MLYVHMHELMYAKERTYFSFQMHLAERSFSFRWVGIKNCQERIEYLLKVSQALHTELFECGNLKSTSCPCWFSVQRRSEASKRTSVVQATQVVQKNIGFIDEALRYARRDEA